MSAYSRPGIIPPATIEDVIMAISNIYGISHDELRQKSKLRRYADARMVCAYVLRKIVQPAATLQATGLFLMRDHSSVSHMVKTFEELYGMDKEFTAYADRLLKRICKN